MLHDSWTPSAPAPPRGNPPRRQPSFLGAEYNNFLYAAAGEAQAGGPASAGFVSVLSALARLDLDPWAEAAKLAQLPRESAAQRLAGLIGPLSAGASPAQSRKTAARLVALLPAAPANAIPAQLASSLPATGDLRSITMFLLIFMAVMLGLQFASHLPRTAPAVGAPSAHVTQNWAGHGPR